MIGNNVLAQVPDLNDFVAGFATLLGPRDGVDTTIGERLRRVRYLLEGEEIFLANYGDTLTDAPLPRRPAGHERATVILRS